MLPVRRWAVRNAGPLEHVYDVVHLMLRAARPLVSGLGVVAQSSALGGRQALFSEVASHA